MGRGAGRKIRELPKRSEIMCLSGMLCWTKTAAACRRFGARAWSQNPRASYVGGEEGESQRGRWRDTRNELSDTGAFS